MPIRCDLRAFACAAPLLAIPALPREGRVRWILQRLLNRPAAPQVAYGADAAPTAATVASPVRRRVALMAAAAFLALAASEAVRAQGAAGGHGHAHTGQEQKIGPYEAELTVRGSEATLTILDDKEQPVDAAQFSATAVALARGNERRSMEFRPAGANRLTARVDFPFDGKFRATVTLRGPSGNLGSARYNVDPVR